MKRKKVLALSGSIRTNSSNAKIIAAIAAGYQNELEFNIYQDLSVLPHFNPDATDQPAVIVSQFLEMVELADAVLICTPEYIFSPPAVLKNALEWTVASTVFSEKPVALIVASGLGEKTFESLKLILATLGTSLTEKHSILIQGARSKLDLNGNFSDEETARQLDDMMRSFISALNLK